MRSTLVAAVLAAALAPQPALSDTPDVVVHVHEGGVAEESIALPQKNVVMRSESKSESKQSTASNPEEAEPCSWKEWGDWSRCSVSCGEGRWVRTRVWVGDESCRMTDELLARSMQSANCSVDCGSGKESPVPSTTGAAPDDAKSRPKRKPCNNGRPASKKKDAKIDDVIKSLAPSTTTTPNASTDKEAEQIVDVIKDVLTNKSKPESNTSSDVVDAMIRENEDIISPSNKSRKSSKPIKEAFEAVLSPSNKSRLAVDKILEAVVRENKSSNATDRPAKKMLEAIIAPLTNKSQPPSVASRKIAADILDAVANASSGDEPINTVEDVVSAINKSDRRFSVPVPSSTIVTTTTTATTSQLTSTTTTKPPRSAPPTTVTTTANALEELARTLVVGDAAFEVARLSDSTIQTVEDGIRTGLAEMANVSNLCIATQTNVQLSGNRETSLFTSFTIDLLCANATNYHRNCLRVDEEIQWMRGLPVEQLRDTVIRVLQQSMSQLRAADIDGFSVTGFEARTADADTLSFFPRSPAQEDNRRRQKACDEPSAGASPGDTADTFVLPDVSQLTHA